jgi:signal transduction histidine kinase
MTQQFYFAADAAIISRLGRELVARQETALGELIKNAFDADATRVEIVLHDSPLPHLEIKDDGVGMSREDLINGFLRLANDNKVRQPISSKFARRRAGRKGIGRFASQRLGDSLTLTTRTEQMQFAIRLTADWSQFTRGKELGSVAIYVDDDVPQEFVGTRMIIGRLADSWTDAQVRRCWRSVLALQQPFRVAPIKGHSKRDPGFEVVFSRQGDLVRDELVIANLESEVLSHLHATIELKVSDSGHAFWRLSKNSFGPTRDWQPIHHEFIQSASPPPYESLRNVFMRSYYAILDPALFSPLLFTRLRDVLSEQGGIRLYRNGFRVVPYGDPDNDWLRLDEMYAKRSLLVPVANRNFFGIVEIDDPDGTNFEEHTSREGLIETPAFLELRDLASSALTTATLRIGEDRGRKTKAGSRPQPEPPSVDDALSKLQSVIDAAREAAEHAVNAPDLRSAQQSAAAAASSAANAGKLVVERRSQIAAVEGQMATEAAMLRFLATMGMATVEFSHETGMTFDAFRMDFSAVFEAVEKLLPADALLQASADRAKRMLLRLDTLTAYLNVLAGARAVRELRPISVGKAILDFERGMKEQARVQGIALTVSVPDYDPLFTRPMHDAELASVLLNFFTNAVKAIKRSAIVPRLIHVSADRLAESQFIRIQFWDTGDGIPESNRERIFDAFFTTSAAPPAGNPEVDHVSGAGLGLWIVQQIAANAGGDVYVAAPSPGYSTCIELVLPAEEEDAPES